MSHFIGEDQKSFSQPISERAVQVFADVVCGAAAMHWVFLSTYIFQKTLGYCVKSL
jgi:hypothetical protein